LDVINHRRRHNTHIASDVRSADSRAAQDELARERLLRDEFYELRRASEQRAQLAADDPAAFLQVVEERQLKYVLYSTRTYHIIHTDE
jgi:hypothetical protein